MNVLVYHIVSGQAWFTGIGMILSAIGSSLSKRRALTRFADFGMIVGILLAVISSTPIAWWLALVLLVATTAWIIARCFDRHLRMTSAVAACAWLVAAALEIPFHLTPALVPVASRSLTVIGDSVTAGIDGDERSDRWPILLARQHDLAVHDIAHMGETASSARKRIESLRIDSPVVLLEIGGNDILGSTSPRQFATDLEDLLRAVAAPDRQLIMFELPLPPFSHEYGRIQRALAREYRVALVPKRVFLSVLAGSASTLDSVHLSQAGHLEMANTVWSLVEPAFPSSD